MHPFNIVEDREAPLKDNNGFLDLPWKPLSWSYLQSSLVWTFFSFYFIYLATADLSCSMWDVVPRPGLETGLLIWEHGVSVTGPPGQSLILTFKDTDI